MDHVKANTKHALEHQEELIKMFAAEPQKKLEKRIKINHLLYALAEKAKDNAVGEFLNIMERIIIEAMFYKADNNIPDEVNEIEQDMAEAELVQEKHEQRKKLLKKLPANPTESVQDLTEHHIIEPAKEEPPQLSLF